MDISQIKEELTSNQDLNDGLLSHFLENDRIKEAISNKANNLYKSKISDEIKNIHSLYDKDLFEILGEKPSRNENGEEQKTYDKIKDIYKELKQLRSEKDSFTKVNSKDQNVETSNWEKTFNTEKTNWLNEKQSLLDKLNAAENEMVKAKKMSEIEKGLREIKFNEDIPEVAVKAFVDTVVNKLLNNSKIEDNEIIYLNEEGSRIVNSEYKPMNANEILKKSLADIIKTENKSMGGGAHAVLKGNIETKNIEGKNVKRLSLNESSIKSKSEFLSIAEGALISAGITRDDQQWDILKNEAYLRYDIAKLPR